MNTAFAPRARAAAQAPDAGISAARASLARHSKSFALAGKLLPKGCREEAAVVYAWCRRADDLVDDAPPGGAARAAAALRRELDEIYAGTPQEDPVLGAFQRVVQRARIPREYLDELLAGLEMDAAPPPIVYPSRETLDLYCYRVAGTVGLMMCHVMGIADERCLRNAAHLGMAMQLTNISRDVAEDWARGRLYVPADLLGAVATPPTPPLRGPLVEALRRALPQLLARADLLYRSGDAGLPALSFRCAVAIRTARLVYAAIGDALGARGFDVTAGRAVVPARRKVWLLARAAVGVAASRLAAVFGRHRRAAALSSPSRVLRYPHDVFLDQ